MPGAGCTSRRRADGCSSEWSSRCSRSAIKEARVIPNGVDLSVFRPADKRSARAALGIPPDADVLLVMTGHRGGMWRDHRTLVDAAGLIAARGSGRDIRIVVLGGDSGGDGVALRAAGANVLEVGFQASPIAVARYFQAADVYLHAARADTFPTVILEALACGTPVVATAVGGIPEQIRSAPIDAVRAERARTIGARDGDTGPCRRRRGVRRRRARAPGTPRGSRPPCAQRGQRCPRTLRFDTSDRVLSRVVPDYH